MKWDVRCSDADNPKAMWGRGAQVPQRSREGVVRKTCKALDCVAETLGTRRS